MIQAIRPFLLAVLAVLVGAGILPQDVSDAVQRHADAILAGVLALWSLVGILRNRKDAKAKTDAPLF